METAQAKYFVMLPRLHFDWESVMDHVRLKCQWDGEAGTEIKMLINKLISLCMANDSPGLAV